MYTFCSASIELTLIVQGCGACRKESHPGHLVRCRRCGYCEPCPQGVRIPTVMNVPSFWKRMPAARLTGGWLGEVVECARNCIECGECEEKCPDHLPIRAIIAENIAFYERAVQAPT
jgi:predicted aldo/keto reductase-like oxidoreductase